MHMFILAYSYCQKWRVKFNFVWGHAQMAAYHSRRNKREFSLDLDLNTFFIRMMKARLKIDYNLYSTTTNVEEFKSRWCFSVENDLMSGLISGSFLLLFENALSK